MSRTALILAALMLMASVVAKVATPDLSTADPMVTVRLEEIVPRQFGDWREVPQGISLVNPQTQELLDKIYNQILTRSYVDETGYVIMLSIAYGSDQRGALQAHKPEVCYPAQGFTLHSVADGLLSSPFGEIPVTRLSTSLQSRREPVTYWFTVGEETVQSRFQKRLVELRYNLTGQIPDGLLFRVSSIDADPVRAYAMQQRFVGDLLENVDREGRVRLIGLNVEARDR